MARTDRQGGAAVLEVQPRSTQTEYNVVVGRKTRRQWLLAVWLPVILVFLVVIGLTWLIAAQPDAGPGGTTVWSHVATIALLIPQCAMSLVCLIVVLGLCYAMFRLAGVLPRAFFRIHRILVSVQQAVERVSNAAAKPLISAYGTGTMLRRLPGALRSNRARLNRKP